MRVRSRPGERHRGSSQNRSCSTQAAVALVCFLPGRGFGQPSCHDPGRGIMIRIVCPHVRGVGRAGVVISKTPAEPVNGLPQPACHGWGSCGAAPIDSFPYILDSDRLSVGWADLPQNRKLALYARKKKADGESCVKVSCSATHQQVGLLVRNTSIFGCRQNRQISR